MTIDSQRQRTRSVDVVDASELPSALSTVSLIEPVSVSHAQPDISAAPVHGHETIVSITHGMYMTPIKRARTMYTV